MPSVSKGETHSHYMARCVPYVLAEKGTKSRAHAVAKCEGMWRQARPTVNARRMNTLRLDPTRTTMLRLKFVREMRRRFEAFRRALQGLVVKEDAFGLARKGVVVLHQRYVAMTTPEQLEEFRRFAAEQSEREITGGGNWLASYTEEAYERGQGRAFDDAMKKYGYGGRASPEYYQGSREQFLRDSFRRPASVERVSLLASRSYTDLKGVTEQMNVQLNRTMTDAIIQGRSPREVGRELNKVVDGYRNRGVTIARTETIRAHAEGQLDSLKNLGVEEVGVMVEWSTAGDDLVCDLCTELDGAVLKIDEARGMIPRHPNCRCCWLPANVGEDAKGQKKGGEAQAAVDRSIAGEIPKGLRGRRPLEEQRGISRWPGADAKVGRPLGPVDVPPATPPKPAPPKPKPAVEPKLKTTAEKNVIADDDVIKRIDAASKKGYIKLEDLMPVEEQLYDVAGAEFLQRGRVVRLKVTGNNKLIATQDVAVTERVKLFANNPEMTMLRADAEDKLPKIFRHNNQLYVHDGHHRVVSAKFRGEEYINVVYLEDSRYPGSLDLSKFFKPSNLTIDDLKR